jgi:hypothetical protein
VVTSFSIYVEGKSYARCFLVTRNGYHSAVFRVLRPGKEVGGTSGLKDLLGVDFSHKQWKMRTKVRDYAV